MNVFLELANGFLDWLSIHVGRVAVLVCSLVTIGLGLFILVQTPIEPPLLKPREAAAKQGDVISSGTGGGSVGTKGERVSLLCVECQKNPVGNLVEIRPVLPVKSEPMTHQHNDQSGQSADGNSWCDPLQAVFFLAAGGLIGYLAR